jgi:hypothetical protein
MATSVANVDKHVMTSRAAADRARGLSTIIEDSRMT